MRKKDKLIHGWGINDVKHLVVKEEVVNGKRKIIWCCPYYTKWKSMLQRTFDFKYQNKQPTYTGCSICEEWKYLSNFIKWVDSQPNRDWKNCALDKDILIENNKIYSPDSCVFIAAKVNAFVTTCLAHRGDFLLGVHWHTESKKFVSKCSNPFNINPDVGRYLGLFDTELEAHKAWQAKKHEYACLLAEEQKDPRVADALRNRYAPDKDWSNK